MSHVKLFAQNVNMQDLKAKHCNVAYRGQARSLDRLTYAKMNVRPLWNPYSLHLL